MRTAAQIGVERLYISSGHNFTGHHGQTAGVHRIVECAEIHCVAGRGIVGDRFFDHKENYKGQITFFDMEMFGGVCRELGLSGQSPDVLRAFFQAIAEDCCSVESTERCCFW